MLLRAGRRADQIPGSARRTALAGVAYDPRNGLSGQRPKTNRRAERTANVRVGAGNDMVFRGGNRGGGDPRWAQPRVNRECERKTYDHPSQREDDDRTEDGRRPEPDQWRG